MRNDPVEPATRARAVAAAQGNAPFDLLLAGGTLVDVGCGELRAADVGIVGPLIASVHNRGTRADALEASHCTGRFVAAGIDSGKLVSGHAAGLTGPVLQAYLAAGMTSDHEIFTVPDCLEKLRAGMTVELRGMMDEILPGIVADVNSLPLAPTHLVAA